MSATLLTRPGLRRLRTSGDRLFRLSLAFAGLVVVVAIVAPWISPDGPNSVDLGASLSGSSASHWLGADSSGRDILSRLILGSRTSLLGPLGVVAVSTTLGVAIGVAAAWYGGWVDTVLSRCTELVFAFPGLLLAILVVALYGPGLAGPVLALSVAYMPFTARLTRSLARAEKERPYLASYRVQGFSAWTTCTRHLIPNISPVILAQATINFGYALLDLAGLSYLGLGVQPPTADWGAMINDGQPAMLQGYPMSSIAPCVAIVLTVVAFNVVGERLADRVARRDK